MVGWVLCWDGWSTWKRENNTQLCEKPKKRIQQDLSRLTGGRTDEPVRLYVEEETRKPDTPLALTRMRKREARGDEATEEAQSFFGSSASLKALLRGNSFLKQ